MSEAIARTCPYRDSHIALVLACSQANLTKPYSTDELFDILGLLTVSGRGL